MAWFNFLKAEGFFAPENNPSPIPIKEGFQVPFWEVLNYLEKLSIAIKEGNKLELIDSLLEVITNVSEHPKDNYRTWYYFIKILNNIPNEKIPAGILQFIPVWLSGRFDTMVQTSELCGKLLPKFLNDNPTEADIKKAELILNYLFSIDNKELPQNDFWDGEGKSYTSKVYLHFLSEKLKEENLLSKIVQHCSSDLILELGRTIKFLLLDYPQGINAVIKDQEKEYEVRIFIEKENLSVRSTLKDSEKSPSILSLQNWENKSDSELQKKLISILKQQKINYSPSDKKVDLFQRLIFALNSDLFSNFRFTSIRKLDDRYSNTEDPLNVFSVIFRNLLSEKAKQNPNESITLLKTFCFDKKYYLPFYKRIALYVICENWEVTKSLFWELIKEKDDIQLFSTHSYSKELYDLLNKNQYALLKSEKTILQGIIEKGNKNKIDEQDQHQNKYWKLHWYAALRDIEPFREKYLALSDSLNITNEHFENQGELRIRKGSISPVSSDELLQMENQEIVQYLKTFKPYDTWEGPNISGLADTLGNAVEIDPNKFATEINLFEETPYIYSYHILNGFRTAWKNQNSFDWEKVLQYCLSTLRNKAFWSDQFKLEHDTWNASPEWVLGSIAELLSIGMQRDENAFDLKFLPIAENIIQILIQNLKPIDDFESSNMDYPTYSLNSLAGKSLNALLNYSLRKARNKLPNNPIKWEPEMKSLFESTLEKGIIDGYILEGMHFEQFYYLDSEWITDQMKKLYQREKQEWLAFVNGFGFSPAPPTFEIYDLFYPHYERIIDNNIRIKKFHTNNLVRHLVSFYFWKYETLESQKLLFKFLNKSAPEEVGELIAFIGQQAEYQNSLNRIERNEFQQMILTLWEFLVAKYEDSKIEIEQKNLALLSNWIVFAPELNSLYAKLILKSIPHIQKEYLTHRFLKKLNAIKDIGNPKIVSSLIGQILMNLSFKAPLGEHDRTIVRELVIFLFNNDNKQVAQMFCNKMASKFQHFFLRDLYDTNL